MDGDDELRGPRLRCDLLTQTGDMDVHAPRQQRLILPTPPTAAASMSSIQHHRRGAAVPAVRRLCRRPNGRLNASVPLEHTPTSLRFTARRDRRRSRRAIGHHAIRTGFQLEANRITRTCSAAQRAPSPSRASKRSRAASRRPSRTTLGDPRVAVARTSSPPAIERPSRRPRDRAAVGRACTSRAALSQPALREAMAGVEQQPALRSAAECHGHSSPRIDRLRGHQRQRDGESRHRSSIDRQIRHQRDQRERQRRSAAASDLRRVERHARAIDETDGRFSLPADRFNVAAERGPSLGDGRVD